MNHPNRNWRARMRAAADQWLASPEGLVLSGEMTRRTPLVTLLRLAYLAGLRDGERREADLLSLDGRR